MKELLTILSLLGCSVIYGSNDSIVELSWPREIDTDDLVITLYQPQLESFKGNILEGRMAVSVKPNEGDMLFAALWFSADMETDLELRTASLDGLQIPRVHFPGIEDTTKIQSFKDLLIREARGWNVVMSLDRLLASFNEVEDLERQEVKLNNDPPEIFFRTSPTVLVSIDGEPITKADETSGIEYVVNTPFFFAREGSNSKWYLNGGNFWYSSSELTGLWNEDTNVPSTISSFAAANQPEYEEDSVAGTLDAAPAVLVTTKPAELIMTDGDPDYATIEGTGLLYGPQL